MARIAESAGLMKGSGGATRLGAPRESERELAALRDHVERTIARSPKLSEMAKRIGLTPGDVASEALARFLRLGDPEIENPAGWMVGAGRNFIFDQHRKGLDREVALDPGSRSARYAARRGRRADRGNPRPALREQALRRRCQAAGAARPACDRRLRGGGVDARGREGIRDSEEQRAAGLQAPAGGDLKRDRTPGDPPSPQSGARLPPRVHEPAAGGGDAGEAQVGHGPLDGGALARARRATGGCPGAAGCPRPRSAAGGTRFRRSPRCYGRPCSGRGPVARDPGHGPRSRNGRRMWQREARGWPPRQSSLPASAVRRRPVWGAPVSPPGWSMCRATTTSLSPRRPCPRSRPPRRRPSLPRSQPQLPPPPIPSRASR